MIKRFNEFIGEAYSPEKVKNEISGLFTKNGFIEPAIRSNSISVRLPDGMMKAPVEIVKLEKEIKNWSKSNDGVLTIKTSVGYSAGNSFSVMIASGSVRVNKAYHKTSRVNATEILKNGMFASEANGHSDTFGAGLSGNNLTEQLYKANFAVTSIGAAKKLDKYFNFGDDSVILEISGKNYSWLPDPLMPPDMKSVFTYDDIKADDISIKE
jgi:hypothetical protein